MKTARNEVDRLNNEIARLQAQVLSQNKKIADTDDAIMLADAYIKERETAPQRILLEKTLDISPTILIGM